jgi:hypothetical protein
LRSGARDEQIGVGKVEAHGSKRLKQQIKSLFVRESSDGEQMGAGAGPVRWFASCRLHSVANSSEVHGIGEHGDSIGFELKHTDQIRGHGARLAYDAIRMPVEKPVEEARIAGQSSFGEDGGDGSVLTHQHTRGVREEGAQQENEKVEMRHPREDDVWS